MAKLTVNGEELPLDFKPDMPPLWALRDVAGLTSTKFSCSTGVCGACTIHLEGMMVRACVPPVAPAVCNAVFALTGQRICRLPIPALKG